MIESGKVSRHTKILQKAALSFFAIFDFVFNILGNKTGKYSELGNMSFEDEKKYSSWDCIKRRGIILRGTWSKYWELSGYTSGGIKEAVVNPA